MESHEVKKHLEHLQVPLPALEESDIDTDDKNSLSGSPTFESGGDLVEHDMWNDHPT